MNQIAIANGCLEQRYPYSIIKHISRNIDYYAELWYNNYQMDDIKREHPFIKSRTNVSEKGEMRVMIVLGILVLYIIGTGFYSLLVYTGSVNVAKVAQFIDERSFYKKNYYEVRGKVISFREYVDSNGINNQTYYSIDVKVRNGKTYHITSPDKKARKYGKKAYITVLVPRNDVYKIKDEENAVLIKEDLMTKSEFVCSLIIVLIVLAVFECYNDGIDIFGLFK